VCRLLRKVETRICSILKTCILRMTVGPRKVIKYRSGCVRFAKKFMLGLGSEELSTVPVIRLETLNTIHNVQEYSTKIS
jgi:hypothetical protein